MFSLNPLFVFSLLLCLAFFSFSFLLSPLLYHQNIQSLKKRKGIDHVISSPPPFPSTTIILWDLPILSPPSPPLFLGREGPPFYFPLSCYIDHDKNDEFACFFFLLFSPPCLVKGKESKEKQRKGVSWLKKKKKTSNRSIRS